MKKVTKIGFMIFAVGLILLFFYGIYEGFQKISLEKLDFLGTSILIITLIGLGILFISIIFEQQEGKKKMKNEIKKEDLEPW